MVEVKSTITPKLQADNKQTATKRENPSSAFQCPEDQMQQYPWHRLVPPLLSGENSRGTGSLGSIRRQQPPVDTTCTDDNAESPPRDVFGVAHQLRRAKAREKEYGGHQVVSNSWHSSCGAHLWGLQEISVRWGGFSARDSAVQVRVRTGNPNWCYWSFVTVRWYAW